MANKNPYMDYVSNGGYGLFEIPKAGGKYKLPTGTNTRTNIGESMTKAQAQSASVGNILNAAGSVINGVGGVVNGFNTAQGLKDTSSLQSSIDNRASNIVDYNDYSTLLNSWSSDKPLGYASMSDIKDGNSMFKGAAQGALAGASGGAIFGPLGAGIGAGIGLLGGVLGGIFGSNKAKKKLRDLNEQIDKANKNVQDNFINSVENIDTVHDNRLASSFYADGGYTPSSALAGYIKSKEYFVPYVYDDRGGAKRRWDPNNRVAKNSVSTIGYGFTDKDLINSYLSSGKQMTKEEADKRLEYELNRRIKEVSSLPNFHRLTQHQQDAIMALDYAVGFGNIKKNKALYKALESGNSEELANVLYNYTLGMKDPRIAKGIRNAWDSLGNMAKYGEYKNPYSGQVIDNRGGIPYRNAARGYMDNIINEQLNAKNDERLAEQQRKERILHPLINWDELPKISGLTDTLLTDYTFAEGGPINDVGNYTEFNAGGTHEENPNNGVQFGVNPETQEPMKAEEGEVKVGDYIFSNRIKPDKSILKVLGLPQKGELSYADIAKALKKKLDKRPNDEIMNKYYNQTIDKLKEAQESTKRLREKAKENIIANASHSLGLVQDPNETQDLGLPNGEELFAEGGDAGQAIRNYFANPTEIYRYPTFRKNKKGNIEIQNYQPYNIYELYDTYKYMKELKIKDRNHYNHIVEHPSIINQRTNSLENLGNMPNDLTFEEFSRYVGHPKTGIDALMPDNSIVNRFNIRNGNDRYYDLDTTPVGPYKKEILDKGEKKNFKNLSLDEAYSLFKRGERIIEKDNTNKKRLLNIDRNISKEEFSKKFGFDDDSAIKSKGFKYYDFDSKPGTLAEKMSYSPQLEIIQKNASYEHYKMLHTAKKQLGNPVQQETKTNLKETKTNLNKEAPINKQNGSNTNYLERNLIRMFNPPVNEAKKQTINNLKRGLNEPKKGKGEIPKFIKNGGFWADMPFGTKTSIDPKTKKLIHTPDTLGSELKRNYPAVYEGLKRANYKLQYGYTPETHIPLKPGIKPKVVDNKIYNGGTLPEVTVRGRRGSSGRVNNTRSSTSIPQNSTNNYITDKPTFEFTPEQVLGIRDAAIAPNTPTLNIPKEVIALPEVAGSGVKLSDAVNSKSGTTNNGSNNTGISNILGNFDVANLRYAPIVNAGLNVFTDLIGATNYDDFTTANNLENEYRRTFKNVAPELISGSLEYKPFDTDYVINKLQAQGAANRQAILNNSGGNRATATAGLLASDYNLMGNIGNEMIKAQDYNYQQRKQIADFDRQKDIFNAQQINSNYQINNSINSARMSGIERAAAMREQEKAINAQNRNINRNMFIDTMASIGREEQDRRFANVLTQYQIENGRIKYNKDK